MKNTTLLFLALLLFSQASFAKVNYIVGQTPAFKKVALSDYPTEQLLHYLTLNSINWHYEIENSEWQDFIIIDELVSRSQVDILLKAFEKPVDEYQKRHILRVLYRLKHPSINLAFQQLVSTDLSDTSYHVLNYLGEQGDRRALKILNDNFFKYSVSSYQWAHTVTLFGKHKYYPATENLINSLSAMSLNLSGAAIEALEIMYPNAPKDFKGPSDAEKKIRAFVESIK